MVHPAVLSHTAAFSCLIISEWKASFTISTTKPKSDGSNGISTSNFKAFQSQVKQLLDAESPPTAVTPGRPIVDQVFTSG